MVGFKSNTLTRLKVVNVRMSCGRHALAVWLGAHARGSSFLLKYFGGIVAWLLALASYIVLKLHTYRS